MTDTGSEEPSTGDEQPWRGDVNEAVTEEWKDDTTPFDRVKTVLDTTAEPAYASEIAERAAVSEPTARKYLATFGEMGRAETVPVENGRKYKRSRQSLATQRIAAIHRAHSKDELVEAIADLRADIGDLQDEHGVTDPDDLAFELADDSDDWSDIARWRSLEENLDVAKAALALFDYDPDHDGDDATTAHEAETHDESEDRVRGALAGPRSRQAG